MLFDDEKAITKHFCEKLIEKGFEIIGTDAIVYKGKRVDVLAKTEGSTYAFEIKRFGRRGILDDIRKLQLLGFLPEIDFFYVAAPKINLQEDILAFAKKLGVGIVGITEEKLDWLIRSERRQGSSIYTSRSHPNLVKPGDIFEFHISVKAVGEKMLRNIEVMFLPAWPFRVAKGEKNHKVIRELMPGEEKPVSFKIRIENKSEEGIHPLFSRITARSLKPYESLDNIQIKRP